MKPAPFEYHRPSELRQALSLLKDFREEAKILAGGQSLAPMMNFRLSRPGHLIDINFVDGLDYVTRQDGGLSIGCLARQARLLTDPVIKQACPLLAEAGASLGYPQTRSRGTLCGSLAHADPAAELPTVLVALDGRVRVEALESKREIEAKDLFETFLTTSVSAEELVLDAWFPEMPAGAGWSYLKFARRFGDFSLVAVAVLLVVDGETVSEARIALAGVGDKPWRRREVEEMLIGEKGSEELFKGIGHEVSLRVDPNSDLHASAAYRRTLSQVLTRRALQQAWERARPKN